MTTPFVTRCVRLVALLCALWIGGSAGPAFGQATETPHGKVTTTAQEEYVPIDQLPENEKLPAAPFLVGAYAVAWVAILGYLLMLWRRLGRVEAELRDARRTAGGR
jgi:CcmD family protein